MNNIIDETDLAHNQVWLSAAAGIVAGLRLLHLVNDILDATALAHNRLVLQQQKVVLRPLCEEVADITRATVRADWTTFKCFHCVTCSML